jgi:ABC-type nitrate/sulfonate/bicarbonate transport system permease component
MAIRTDTSVPVQTGAASPASGWRGRATRYYQRHDRIILGSFTVIVLLLLWQVLADAGVANKAFTSSPVLIWKSLVDYFTGSGTGWTDLGVSGWEFLTGFLISIAVGVPAGILTGWFRALDALFNPLVIFLNIAPRIAIAPLFVIWFGIGTASKVWVVVLSAMIPIILATRSGIATVDRSLVAMARSYGASQWRILRTVVFPGTIPAISSGLRLGVGQAWLGVVLAEYIASTKGLGFVIVTSASNFNTDRLFADVIVITVLGLLVTALVGRLEHYLDRWRTT